MSGWTLPLECDVRVDKMPEEPLIQKYWYKGNHPERPKLVTRSYTKNALHPSPAQATQRLKVGDISKSAKGMKMNKGDNLPPAAKLVERYGSGPTGVETRINMPIWKQELFDYIDMETGTKTEKEILLDEVFQLLESAGA